MDFPVILIVDNDEGLRTIGNAVKEKSGKPCTTSTADAFYYLGQNLYLVKVPEFGSLDVPIEHLFPTAVLSYKIDGRPFEMQIPDKGTCCL